MTPVLLHVLGNVHLSGGRPDALAAAKVRSLTALLAVRVGQVKSTERLVEELWDERPPASARTSLRVHIGNLRAGLREQDAGLSVEYRTPGYRLVCEPDAVDAVRAERLMREASGAAPGRAIALCDDALALWEGDEAYADVPLPALEPERHRLGELRLDLRGLRAEARARQAPPDIAFVAELEELVRQAPTRERFTALLMEALYRTDREVEALAAFRQLNGELGELGLVPSRSLTDLETAVLQQAPALDWRPADPAPTEPVTTPGPPPVSLHRFAGPFVGRVDARARLQRHWDERRDRRGLLVRGEAGIGKTRLVTEFAGPLVPSGAVVVMGTCDPEQLVPFRPFIEILRQLRGVGHEPIAPASQADGDGAEGRLQFFTSVCEQVERVGRAAAGGFLVIVEDVHWIDEASAALLRFLLRARPPLPLFLLATARSDEPEASLAWSRLRAEWSRLDAGIGHLDLAGLSPAEVAALLTDRSRPAGPAPADVLHSLTNGNPLLIEELATDLALRPELWIDDRAALPVPATVSETVRHRLKLLDHDARPVVELAAVTGDGAPVTVVAAAAELSLPDVYRLLGESVSMYLVVEDDARPDAVVFKHALVRQAVVDALPAPTRRQLHARVAAAHGAATPPGVDRDLAIARHLLAAVPVVGLTDAAEAVAVAAEHAVKASAFEAAAAALTRTLDHPRAGDLAPTLVHRLLCTLGLAGAHLDQRDEAAAAFGRAGEIARGLGDPELIAAAALEGDLPDRTVTPTTGRQRLLLEALDHLDRVTHAGTRIRVLSALARDASIPSNYTDRLELAAEAVALAHRTGRPAELFRALTAWYVQQLGRPGADTLGVADEMVRLAEITGDPAWSARVRLMRARERLRTGDMAGADADLAVHRSLAERTRRPRDLWQAEVVQAALARQRGDLGAADEAAGRAVALGRRAGLVETPLVQGVHVFFGHFHRGTLAELAPGLEIDAGTYDTLPVVALSAALAAVQAGEGTPGGTAAALALATDLRRRDELAPVILALGALLAVAVGDDAAMTVIARELDGYAGSVVVVGALTGTFGPVDRYRAVLARHRGDTAAAERLAEQAVELADRLGATTWSLWSRAELAAALLGGDRSAAFAMARDVEEGAAALGLGGPRAAAAAVAGAARANRAPSSARGSRTGGRG
jgi:DNA-binding SARP family transcriptional activator